MAIRKPTFNRKIIAISGGMDPIHIGHIRMIQEASKLGDVIVILNNDNWLKLKKGYVFMNQKERKEIMESIKGVKKVILTRHQYNSKDMSVARTLARINPDYFANGGDRCKGNINSEEEKVCKRLNIKILYGTGGNKIQSSSWLIENIWRTNIQK